MKLGLKDKIDTLLETYRTNMNNSKKMVESKLTPFKNPSYISRFTREGLDEEVKELQEPINNIMKDWENFNKTLNHQVIATVAGAKQKIMDSLHLNQVEKSADYAIRIANAREFVKMELENDYSSKKELDSALFFILKDFVDDYETMKLFERMVEVKCPLVMINSKGECALPKTFGKTQKISSIMNCINEIESSAAQLFIHERHDIETIVEVNGRPYGFPMDEYLELKDEDDIANNAELLDILVKEIDDTEQMDDDQEGGDE